jgi:hypothetical protein
VPRLFGISPDTRRNSAPATAERVTVLDVIPDNVCVTVTPSAAMTSKSGIPTPENSKVMP